MSTVWIFTWKRARSARIASFGSTERSDFGSPGSGSMLSTLTCMQSRPASLKPSTSSGVSLKALVMMVAKLTPPRVALMRATSGTMSGCRSGSPPSRSKVKAPSSASASIRRASTSNGTSGAPCVYSWQ